MRIRYAFQLVVVALGFALQAEAGEVKDLVDNWVNALGTDYQADVRVTTPEQVVVGVVVEKRGVLSFEGTCYLKPEVDLERLDEYAITIPGPLQIRREKGVKIFASPLSRDWQLTDKTIPAIYEIGSKASTMASGMGSLADFIIRTCESDGFKYSLNKNGNLIEILSTVEINDKAVLSFRFSKFGETYAPTWIELGNDIFRRTYELEWLWINSGLVPVRRVERFSQNGNEVTERTIEFSEVSFPSSERKLVSKEEPSEIGYKIVLERRGAVTTRSIGGKAGKMEHRLRKLATQTAIANGIFTYKNE